MGIKDEILVFLISMLPVMELRGGIPFGIAKGLDPVKVFFISVLGNIFPVIPFLFFLKLLVKILEKKENLIGKFFKWWFDKAKKKSKIVELYGFWGLVIFVGIPLPGTGAWTGCVVATLLNLKITKSFFGILLGVLTAGIILLLGSVGVLKLWSIFI